MPVALSPGRVILGSTDLPTLDLLHRVNDFGVRLQAFTGQPQPA